MLRESSITVKLVGGLGNQLHCLAAGIAVSGKLETRLILDTSHIPFGSNKSRLLELHNIELNRELLERIIVLPERNRVLKAAEHFRSSYLRIGRSLVKEYEPTYFDSGHSPNIQLGKISAGSAMSGHFLNFLWADLAVKYGFPTKIAPLTKSKKFIEATNTIDFGGICVHLRLGDYENLRHIFPRVPESYYLDAISEIHGSPKIYIFAEFRNEVQKNYPELSKIENLVVFDKRDFSTVETISLMSKFSTIIASNSTFSSWAGWFGSQNNSKVFSPIPHMYQNWIDELPFGFIRRNILDY